MSRTPMDAPPRWFPPLFMTIGLAIMAVAGGLIPTDPSKIHAPRWILGLVGFVFSLMGFHMFTMHRPGIARWTSLVLVGCFAAIGLWVGLFGEAAAFGGGSSLVSAETNISLARWIFGGMGGGLLIVFLAMLYGRLTGR